MDFQITGKSALTKLENQWKSDDPQGCQSFFSDCPDQCLVYDTEHGNDVDVLRLADEFYKDPNVIESSLGVRESHRAIQEVEGAFLSRVIESCMWTMSLMPFISDQTRPLR